MLVLESRKENGIGLDMPFDWRPRPSHELLYVWHLTIWKKFFERAKKTGLGITDEES